MTTELSEQMELARGALARGEVADARRMLRRIVHQESTNHRAWLWLAGVTDAPEASLQYVKRAQALDPSDPAVASAMTWATKRVADGNSDVTRLIAYNSESFMPAAEVTQIATKAESQAVAATAAAATTTPSETQPEVTNPDAVPAGFSNMVKRVGWALILIALLGIAVVVALNFFSGGGATSSTPAVEPTAMVLFQNKPDSAPSNNEVVAVPRQEIVLESVADAASEPLVVEALVVEQVVDEVVTSAETEIAAVDVERGATVLQSIAPSENSAENNSLAAVQTDASAVVANNQPIPIGFVPKEALPQAQPLPQWTPTPAPTAVPTEEPAAAQPLDAYLFNEARWIDVNLTTQYLTAYENGVPVFSTYISSGLPNTPTVVGQFRIYHRLESQDMNGYAIGFDYYTPDVPYVMYFHGNYAIHGAYWHDNFGQPMSHGCINTSVADGAWLFNFAGIGTLVNVHY